MENRYIFFLIVLLFLGDLIAINCSFMIAYFWDSQSNAFIQSSHYKLDLLIFNATWIVSAFFMQLYHRETAQRTEFIFQKSWRAVVLHALTFNVVVLLTNYASYSKNFLIYIFAFEIIGFLISRFVITAFEQYHIKRVRHKKKIAIVGYNETAKRLADYFIKNQMSYNFSGFFDHTEKSYVDHSNQELIRPIDSLMEFASQNEVAEVYSTLFPEDYHSMNDLLSVAEQNCVRFKFIPDVTKIINSDYAIDTYFDEIPVLSTRSEPLEHIANRIFKRSFDIIFSLGVIIFLLSWLIPILSIIIKMQSKGPVFFMQLRSGRDNKPFWCYKFRSMTMNSDTEHIQATKGDSRVTSIGAFMRKTSIDELPQFFNVLIGNMSIVGPRPHMLKHTDEYKAIVHQYMVRQLLKPGITGWAQVSGFRGETKDHKQMVKRVEHDIWYIENWSIMLDIKIIFLTIINTAKGEENAY
ncbi:MAG: undecaprenyl-phosphate glucose phosphotransferase [Sphingobacteriaceae bacterium]|nr:MAG: undecaprenyl-phosphate glucose phosphotransferase [Sphingobacteriaceae bacterium]